MSRPHVGLYVPALRVGGAQQVTINIANGLADRGFPVDLVVSYDRGDFSGQVSEAVTRVDLGTPEIPGLGIAASVPALRRYLVQNNPDILFSAMTFANVVALTAARTADSDTLVVPTEHDTFGMQHDPKDRLVSRLAGHLYASADHVLGVSTGVVESVVRHTRVPEDRISVMYNPIDTEEIRRRSRERIEHRWATDPSIDLVFTVGRIEPQKDLPTLVAAFESVVDRHPQARLVVAGRGSRTGAIDEIVRERGLEDVVSLPGYVDNPYAYLSRADVFALSSRHEGLPTVLIEALACGCPVVSTDCPSGPAEILRGGDYGRLVPVGDPEALADGIVETVRDPPQPDRLRERADDFATETIIDEYVRFVSAQVEDTPVARA